MGGAVAFFLRSGARRPRRYSCMLCNPLAFGSDLLSIALCLLVRPFLFAVNIPSWGRVSSGSHLQAWPFC